MKRGFQVMDSDIHIMEPPDLYERYLEDRFLPDAPTHVPNPGGIYGAWYLKMPGQNERVPQTPQRKNSAAGPRVERIRPFIKDAIEDRYGPTSTLGAMDVEGVDVAIVFPTLARGHVTLDDLDPEYAVAICRAYNNYLADFCKKDPDRLKGAALISLHSVDLAVEELRRAVQDLGMVCLTIAPNPINGRYFHDPACDPLWKEAQDLNVPVCLHDTNAGWNQGHLANFLRYHPNPTTLTQTFGFPLSLMEAMGSYIVGGVLERFPTLRLAFLEGNCSWLPWLLWRLEEQWEMYKEGEQVQLSLEPTEYFLRQCYVSLEPGEGPAQYVVNTLGDDNLVISTDYPHPDSSYPYAMEHFMELKEIGEASKRKVLWDNCVRLYNL